MWFRRFTTALLIIDLLYVGHSVIGQEDIQIDIQPATEDPVLPLGEAGTWDSVSIRFPYVMYYDGQYHMFYTAFTSLDQPQAIGYATSEDGLHWERYADNPIFEGSGAGFDAFGVNRAVVTVDEDGTWVMYYNGNAGPGAPPFGRGIGRATAPDPTGPWTRSDTPVLQAGSARRWDGAFIFPDAVIKTGDGYVMYYSGNGTGKGMVGRATSPDGITWAKYDDPTTADPPFDESDPVLTPGGWATELAWGSSVQPTDHGWEMFFSGGPANPSPGHEIMLGYAISDDGIHWTIYPDPVVHLADQLILFTSFVIHDGIYFVYYGVAPATGSSKTEPHLATGTITFPS